MIIISSAGRSGSGYVSQVLTKAGLPIGHERIFTPTGIAGIHSDIAGDSSWMAVPHLADPFFADAYKIHLYRDPLAVVRSFVGIDFFDNPSPYRTFMLNQMPALRSMDAFDAACHYYIEWNRLALESADTVWSIDHPAWHQAFAHAKVGMSKLESALDDVPPNYNSRQRADIDVGLLYVSVWDTFYELEKRAS